MMRPRLTARRWWLLVALYMAAIFVVSSIPGRRGAPVDGFSLTLQPTVQNVLHVPLFAGLAWLWWRALRAHGRALRPSAWVAAGAAVAWGVLDELHQGLVPGRYATLGDVALNVLGACLLVVWVYARSRRNDSTASQSASRSADSGG